MVILLPSVKAEVAAVLKRTDKWLAICGLDCLESIGKSDGVSASGSCSVAGGRAAAVGTCETFTPLRRCYAQGLPQLFFVSVLLSTRLFFFFSNLWPKTLTVCALPLSHKSASLYHFLI